MMIARASRHERYMPKFYNSDIADLAHQLTMSPRRLRVDQIRGVERLLAVIDAEKAYPFEFVCHAITKYRKRGAASTSHSIPGKALIEDVCTLAELISRKANLTVVEMGVPCTSHRELADRLEVSTKTVRRWRGRGLLGIRAICADGVNRLVFTKNTIDRFIEQNEAMVAKAASFRQMSPKEREQIVERARALVTEKPLKLHAAARLIAEEMGRAVETVRYTLRRFDQTNDNGPLFGANGFRAMSDQHEAVWDCHCAGSKPAAIARTLEMPRETVEELFREVQVQRWLEESLDWVHNELFEAPNADALILDVPEPPAENGSPTRVPKDLPAYLQALYRTPLLSREQEQDLFRRYNYVRYKAARLIRSFDIEQGIEEAAFEEALSLKGSVDQLRRRVINSNLRLVVSIAKRHIGRFTDFFETVSDGNMTLLRAIDKFDYSLGNKFSTYASWAIIKNYARSIPEEHYRTARWVTGQDEFLAEAPDDQPDEVHDSDRQRVRELIDVGMAELPERDQDIVRSHFGLKGDTQPTTLEQLGERYGVTKERIRQIEQRALAHLREHLSPSLVEALR